MSTAVKGKPAPGKRKSRPKARPKAEPRPARAKAQTKGVAKVELDAPGPEFDPLPPKAVKLLSLAKPKKTLVESLLDVITTPLVLPKGILTPAMAEDATEIPGAHAEPVYDAGKRSDIQGNILPGFNKDHQHFLFFRFGKLSGPKGWLRWLAPQVTSMEEVLAFVRLHRSLRRRLGVKETALKATWVNVAFSRGAIARLASPEEADAFGDESFRQGLAARSTYLGDPTDPDHPGHRSRWVVGGTAKTTADAILIVAADDEADLEAAVRAHKAAALRFGLSLLFEQRGDTLPGSLRGHEHFGFKDGISQPGVRGKASSATGDYITPRYLDHAADPQMAKLFAKPGQPLVWPGQFLLGEPRQNTHDSLAPGGVSTAFPSWARLGSYLVVRRLRQDVRAFWDFAESTGAALGQSGTAFASKLVGRWPSGAPLLRSPSADDPALAGDEWANNHFIYNDKTREARLRPIPGYGDRVSGADPDFLGAVCPHFAHIRKSNPRDIATDLGKPTDSLTRMILRRGIPFGPPLVRLAEPTFPKFLLDPKTTRKWSMVKLARPEVSVSLAAAAKLKGLQRRERGLMFLCYGSSIEDQFEFLSRRWVNSALQPNYGGHDPIIGQRDRRGQRTRFIDVPTPQGVQRVKMPGEWVRPTGGGYFFAPPIGAIASVLGA